MSSLSQDSVDVCFMNGGPGGFIERTPGTFFLGINSVQLTRRRYRRSGEQL